jgi:hypothetical protein
MKGTSIERFGYRLASALLLVGMFCMASAQDFPTFKGDIARSGKGTNFLSSGPGNAVLTWYRPNFTDNIGKTQLVDNLMRPTTTDPDYVSTTGVWFGPTDLVDSNVVGFTPTDLNNPKTGVTYSQPLADASNATPIVITTPVPHRLFTGDQVAINSVVGNTAANGDWTITVLSPTTFSLDTSVGNGPYGGGGTIQGRSDYQFAESIASATTGDGTTPLNATDTLSVFTWAMRNPVVPFYEGHNYAIYVNIPNGQTTVAGVQRFPQRFYVFQVVYSGGSFTDIIDTNISGGGFVRIGGHGGPTKMLFPSDGTTPILVKLYNTVPRDPGTGVLTENPGSGNDLDLSKPRPIVYADAVKAVPVVGSYAATPIVSSFLGSAGLTTTTVAALNEDTVSTLNGQLITTTKGLLTSYDFATGARRWTLSPVQESSLTSTLDNNSSGVTPVGFTADVSNPPTHQGTNFLTAPADTASVSAQVTYVPVLNPASYDIYVWIAGDSGGEVFGHAIEYKIMEGGTENDVFLDQSGTTAKGWVKLGTRSYLNGSTPTTNLSVVVTNFSTNPADTTPVLAYADAIRFVGPSNLAINSTPVQTTALITPAGGGAPVATPVVIVAAENGVIYCLSADGRGDGSTDIIWTYPSTRDPNIPEPPPGSPDTWMDPNLNAPTPIDGTGNIRTAIMPNRFGLSSPLVANVGGVDYLYIASANGRVYCIEMAGRGDWDPATRKVGSTKRVWTFPDDFPAVSQPSNLGEIVGSVAFGNTAPTPTIYVPARHGRLFALDAAGTPATHTTTVKWTYPALTDPTLGEIFMTPAVDFNKVYFGTHDKDLTTKGQFFALDWNTGAVSWTMATPAKTLTDFDGGPVTVDAASLGGGMPDTVFVSNGNLGLYALDAGTGALQWETYESGAPVQAPLTFTIANVFDNLGVLTPAELVVAPQNDGRVSLFYAQTSQLQIDGGRFAGGYTTQSQSMTSAVAVGWNFMYFGDNAGFLYALSNTAGIFPPGTTPPLGTIASQNNPATGDYSQAIVKMIKKPAFIQLRQGTMYYADAIDPSNQIARNPLAFEWGETIYLLIYHFPYQRAGTSTPPVLNVNFTVGGETIRNVFTESRQFPDNSDPTNDYSGYGVFQFTIQPAGANALPPGQGRITIGFNTVDTSGAPVNYPSRNSQDVYIANPLGLSVPGYGQTAPLQQVGATNNTSDMDNLTNGNGALKIYVLGSEGTLAHGQSGKMDIGVIDRSLVELIRGPGRGLQNVRLERNTLNWQPSLVAGQGGPLDPLDPTLFPGFEDQPLQIPNNSLDYPDIYAQAVTVTKSASGNSENPVQYPVELLGPTADDGSQMTEANDLTRALQYTPFSIKVNVPRFQPANEKLGNDQNTPPPGSPDVPAGYSGQYYVFVDTSGNGVLDRPNSFIQTDSEAPAANREAYRSFTLATSVAADRRISVLTPTLDLGSLAEGAGYTPDIPGPSNALFDPWTTQYSTMFKPFILANEGNVNLLNLRLAKATTKDNSGFDPWQIFSPTNEDWAYLDGSVDLWSDMDPKFAPMRDVSPNGMVIGQKSRVGDPFARQVTTNPVARANVNTGIVIDTPRLPATTYPIQAPRVAVTVPFGFPVGTYIALLRIIDDESAGSSPATMWQNLDGSGNPTEPNSEPTLRVTFKPREARVTSTFSALDAPFIDNLPATDTFRYGNMQPSGFRDPTHGSLVLAHSSSRETWVPPSLTSAKTNPQWRIYLSSVAGTDPQTATGTSPLRDLRAFIPDTANGRWFMQSPLTSSGFPDQTLDTSIWGPHVAETVKYGSPVFPENGMQDPFRTIASGMGTPFQNALMAFVGTAQINNNGQTADQSKIFVAPVSVDSAGAVGIGNVYAMTNDPGAEKGKPSILQTQNGFVLFYSATVGGRSNIYYVLPSNTAGANQYDGSYFSQSTALDLGEGFESVSSPNVSGRLLRGGANPAGAGDPIIEFTFAGKLHGRPVSEVFYGRIALDTNLEPNGLMSLPVRTQEPMVQSAQAGSYLAEGVEWQTAAPITLQVLRNGVYTDIEVGGTRQTERGTGIITFDTKLGGKAYLDPTMGMVRLSGSQPSHDSTLLLTYQPKLLRISEGTTAGYAAPNVAFDERLIPDVTYWRRAGDGSAVDETDPVRTGRYVFTYGRAAAGAGQSARPMLKTMRLGVELPLPVFTNADGSTGAFSVTTSGQPLQYYQIDPAKKKIYFTADDEFKTVTIQYDAADPSTGAAAGTQTVTASVGMIVERPEELVQLDQATNEANVSMFLDPFDYLNFRRPGLVWLLWSSTRAGSPDIYMQTIAPRFTPVLSGK